jgi:hypothetical protein
LLIGVGFIALKAMPGCGISLDPEEEIHFAGFYKGNRNQEILFYP